MFSVALSTVSIGIFGTYNWEGMSALAGYQPYYEEYSWPWHVRVIATVLTACALLTSIVYEWRTRNIESEEEDKLAILSVFEDEDDSEEDDQEYGQAV